MNTNQPSFVSGSLFDGKKITRNDYVCDRLGNQVFVDDILITLDNAFCLFAFGTIPSSFTHVFSFEVGYSNKTLARLGSCSVVSDQKEKKILRAVYSDRESKYLVDIEQTFFIKMKPTYSILECIKIFFTLQSYNFVNRVCSFVENIHSRIISG